MPRTRPVGSVHSGGPRAFNAGIDVREVEPYRTPRLPLTRRRLRQSRARTSLVRDPYRSTDLAYGLTSNPASRRRCAVRTAALRDGILGAAGERQPYQDLATRHRALLPAAASPTGDPVDPGREVGWAEARRQEPQRTLPATSAPHATGPGPGPQGDHQRGGDARHPAAVTPPAQMAPPKTAPAGPDPGAHQPLKRYLSPPPAAAAPALKPIAPPHPTATHPEHRPSRLPPRRRRALSPPPRRSSTGHLRRRHPAVHLLPRLDSAARRARRTRKGWQGAPQARRSQRAAGQVTAA